MTTDERAAADCFDPANKEWRGCTKPEAKRMMRFFDSNCHPQWAKHPTSFAGCVFLTNHTHIWGSHPIADDGATNYVFRGAIHCASGPDECTSPAFWVCRRTSTGGTECAQRVDAEKIGRDSFLYDGTGHKHQRKE